MCKVCDKYRIRSPKESFSNWSIEDINDIVGKPLRFIGGCKKLSNAMYISKKLTGNWVGGQSFTNKVELIRDYKRLLTLHVSSNQTHKSGSYLGEFYFNTVYKHIKLKTSNKSYLAICKGEITNKYWGIDNYNVLIWEVL